MDVVMYYLPFTHLRGKNAVCHNDFSDHFWRGNMISLECQNLCSICVKRITL